MNRKCKFTREAIWLIALFLFVLAGCASQNSGELSAGEFESSFATGTLRLTCGVSCSGSWGYNRSNVKQLYAEELWQDVARTVYSVGFASDQTYFYLGRAAEGLGYDEAARTYYKLGRAGVHQCDGIVNNCDGLDVPSAINERLAALPAAPPAARKIDAPSAGENNFSSLETTASRGSSTELPASWEKIPHWSETVLGEIENFEQYPSVFTMKWKELSKPEQGQYESKEEFERRVEAQTDHTKTMVWDLSIPESFVPNDEEYGRFAMFQFSPFESVAIDRELNVSEGVAQNAFGAKWNIISTKGEEVLFVPKEERTFWYTEFWKEKKSETWESKTHNLVPIERDALLNLEPEVFLIRLFSVEESNPDSFSEGVRRQTAKTDSPFEVDVKQRKISGKLEFAGLYDSNSEQFILVFKENLQAAYDLLNGKEYDLTLTRSDVPYGWRD